jgi:hypothetical protein
MLGQYRVAVEFRFRRISCARLDSCGRTIINVGSCVRRYTELSETKYEIEDRTSRNFLAIWAQAPALWQRTPGTSRSWRTKQHQSTRSTKRPSQRPSQRLSRQPQHNLAALSKHKYVSVHIATSCFALGKLRRVGRSHFGSRLWQLRPTDLLSPCPICGPRHTESPPTHPFKYRHGLKGFRRGHRTLQKTPAGNLASPYHKEAPRFMIYRGTRPPLWRQKVPGWGGRQHPGQAA